jgi:hypothetical protein
MIVFLRHIQTLTQGFAPGVQSRELAEIADVPDALIDAVFVSARMRGLIEPDFTARSKRTRWKVSARGTSFIDSAATSPQGEPTGD